MTVAAVAVLVPVKAFSHAKLRLAPALDPAEREALARSMAAAVLAAGAPLPCYVVCDDDDVAAWASEHGARVLFERGKGLNVAVTTAVTRLGELGHSHVIVSHADLPLATSLRRLAHFRGVTLVPDRREDGTNVVAVPTRAGFRFSYGPGSFRRHLAEAERIALGVHVVRDVALGYDVDLPADLAALPTPA